jgi:hypothetical protein
MGGAQICELDEGRSAKAGMESQFTSVFRARVHTGEELMNRRTTSMLAGMTIAALPALAAEVTPERLINADREPQNWLMNHRTYDSQRYSLLDKINKANVKSLKIAYAVAIGGTSANESQLFCPWGRSREARLAGLGWQRCFGSSLF